MRRILKLFLLATIFGALNSPANAEADWNVASDCFNAGDFDCAYENALSLAEIGRIVVGHDHRTTDSMTFFQMAFIERAARVSVPESTDMSVVVLKGFGRQQARLPFIWGFAMVVAFDSCESDECRQAFQEMYCQTESVLPPPSWRPLHNTNVLSEIGQNYFDRILLLKPNCTGS